MAKVPCPKCGRKASPNARGPDYVHCKHCGGLVAVDQSDSVGAYCNSPEAAAMAHERGLQHVGVRRLTQFRELGGGL